VHSHFADFVIKAIQFASNEVDVIGYIVELDETLAMQAV
jgi:hypothetical protein